jgi:hypothetical protein
MRNRGVKRIYVRSAYRVHLPSLDLVQESVVFLNHGALKSSLAPTQAITLIPAYWGREMLVPVLFDEFNHILDVHRHPLTDVDVTATIESSPCPRKLNSRPSYTVSLCPQILKVVIEEEFVGSWAEVNLSQFALSLVADPRLNQILRKDIALH